MPSAATMSDRNDLPSLQALSAEAIGAAALAAGEPEWLVAARQAAWEHFEQSPPPMWRRTDLSGLAPHVLVPPATRIGTELFWDESLASAGVIFIPLAEAVKRHEELVRPRLGSAVKPLDHKFSALRAALWQDGVLLYVPRGCEVTTPLRVRYTLPSGARAIFPYSLVLLEPNSRVTFIEEYRSADSSEVTLAAPASELFAGPGSTLHFISAQRWGTNVYHIGGQMVVLERDATCEWTSLALGGHTQHIEAETRLQGDGSRVNWLGATFANGSQRLLTAPWLRHVGRNAESFMQFKTVVNDTGYSIFDGMIKIEHESGGTSTRLEEHALHLSPQARNDSIPGLMIDTNDVLKGGHASTSGDVDEQQLFYMQSRGIGRAEAVHMIVMGFFEPALATIPLDEMRNEVTAIIEEKI